MDAPEWTIKKQESLNCVHYAFMIQYNECNFSCFIPMNGCVPKSQKVDCAVHTYIMENDLSFVLNIWINVTLIITTVAITK